ncbi:hypothetical protein HPP92_019655 [Vanilla planifolia]|uniref:EF-hand domain-containing protein n=1 Tax=Vanilla planifolia TaxID=51239 RepID=A0A835ULB8_VANPL|nr:hypothetical protein HPP92_019655 [Vanilla planifolia]
MAPAFPITVVSHQQKTEKGIIPTKLQCMLPQRKSRSLPALGISATNGGGILARLFRCLDEDGDGKISPSELQQFLRRLVGEDLGDEEAIVAVAMHDSDGDGLLCFDDFKRLMSGGAEEGEEEEERRLREAFRVYQMEGEECITPKSLRTTLGRLGERRSVEECEVMIGRYDVNGDGVLSFDEFKLMMI